MVFPSSLPANMDRARRAKDYFEKKDKETKQTEKCMVITAVALTAIAYMAAILVGQLLLTKK